MDSMPIALSWVCNEARLRTSSLQAATVYGIVHFLLLHQPSKISHRVPAAFHHDSNQRTPLALAFLGIWTSLAWVQLSNLPNQHRWLVCLVLLSNAPQAMQAFLHSLQQFEDQSRICTSHFFLFCLLPLLLEESCAPGNTPGNCDAGEFFPLAAFRMKRRL